MQSVIVCVQYIKAQLKVISTLQPPSSTKSYPKEGRTRTIDDCSAGVPPAVLRASCPQVLYQGTPFSRANYPLGKARFSA
jgi:hypothetical protein